MKRPFIRNLLTNKKPLRPLANKHQRRSSDLRRLAHELINQLTVINLSCFKIRSGTVAENEPAILNQLDLIEKTVAEAAEILANLSVDDGAGSARSQFDAAARRKVYPLFKSSRQD